MWTASKAGYFTEVTWKQGPTANDGDKCTNTPLKCLSCDLIIWKYAMEAHWKAKHEQDQRPDPEPWSMKPKKKAHMDGVVG